ncbi:MAG: class I SAM-dependent methyltransferase [Chloroflexota bacterium]
MKETLQEYKDTLRQNLISYTIKAFRSLPTFDEPRILDIGCGSGVPTMELARLSNGRITGLDVDQSQLDRLVRKVEKAGLSDRVDTIGCSMLQMDFPEDTFDIIWAEGSIRAIGFERALIDWQRFLGRGGFLVIHDDMGNLTVKLNQVSHCGYDLLDYFVLGEHIWWDEYYAPLEKSQGELRQEFADDPECLTELDNDQRSIDTFKQNRESYRSVFLIMKKR